MRNLYQIMTKGYDTHYVIAPTPEEAIMRFRIHLEELRESASVITNDGSLRKSDDTDFEEFESLRLLTDLVIQ